MTAIQPLLHATANADHFPLVVCPTVTVRRAAPAARAARRGGCPDKTGLRTRRRSFSSCLLQLLALFRVAAAAETHVAAPTMTRFLLTLLFAVMLLAARCVKGVPERCVGVRTRLQLPPGRLARGASQRGEPAPPPASPAASGGRSERRACRGCACQLLGGGRRHEPPPALAAQPGWLTGHPPPAPAAQGHRPGQAAHQPQRAPPGAAPALLLPLHARLRLAARLRLQPRLPQAHQPHAGGPVRCQWRAGEFCMRLHCMRETQRRSCTPAAPPAAAALPRSALARSALAHARCPTTLPLLATGG